MIVVQPAHGQVILEALSHAVCRWVGQGDGRPLTRWLDHELDSEGVPIRLAIPAWPECLEILAEPKRRGLEWPEGCASRVSRLVLAILRFARPDGSPAGAWGEPGRGPAAAGFWTSWADWLPGTGVARVLRGWFAPGQ